MRIEAEEYDWRSAVAYATLVGALFGVKQRVFKDPVYGWAWVNANADDRWEVMA